MNQKILQILRDNHPGFTFQSLARRLQLLQREKPLLKQKLLELERRGLVLRVKRHYMLLPESRILRGRVVRVAHSFLFVRPLDKNGVDIFVPGRYSEGAVMGDEVELVWQEAADRQGPDGKVLRILKSRKKTLVGFYRVWTGKPYLLPLDNPSAEEIPLVGPLPPSLEEGWVVEIERETRRIVHVLGRLEDPGVDLTVIVRKYDLPEAFSPECLAEAEAGARCEVELSEARTDLREWPTVTIDGEDARDFDDAVSLQKQPQGGFLLGVHIADVSFFVQPGSCLDREALLRGTSVYFPETNLPMLPESLSCDACSLKPGRDRMTVSVLMEIDEEGRLRETRIQPSVIHSDARLTYTEVNEFLGTGALHSKGKTLPDLRLMSRLAALLRRKRVADGSLDFTHPEPRLQFQDGELVEVKAFLPGEAHGIIEEFMLAANKAVAAFLAVKSVPILYRVHPTPAGKDLLVLKERLAYFGIRLPELDRIETRHLNQAQEYAQSLPEEKFISLQILRSLQLAQYSPDNIGHFGLGFSLYTHFTSPIRRYPDLLVHRALKQVWADQNAGSRSLDSVARMSSERERRAEAAEKDLIEWRIFRYLKSRLGDELAGWISDITRAGLVIELEDFFVTGTILFQDLGGDYFVRDSDVSLKGRSTGRTFHMGQKILVVLAAVDPARLRATLVPADRAS